MKFDDLLDACRMRVASYPGKDPIAVAVIDLLGELPGCGFEPPFAEPGMVSILDDSEDPQPSYQFTPGEARWFAAELLRAADEAETAT